MEIITKKINNTSPASKSNMNDIRHIIKRIYKHFIWTNKDEEAYEDWIVEKIKNDPDCHEFISEEELFAKHGITEEDLNKKSLFQKFIQLFQK